MAGKTAKIDGDMSLGDIKDACEVEQGPVFQLISIKGNTETVGTDVLFFNQTTYTRKLSAQLLTKLTFVEVGNKKPEDIRKKMEEGKQTLLCDVSEIYVEKNPVKVMVFGKKS